MKHIMITLTVLMLGSFSSSSNYGALIFHDWTDEHPIRAAQVLGDLKQNNYLVSSVGMNVSGGRFQDYYDERGRHMEQFDFRNLCEMFDLDLKDKSFDRFFLSIIAHGCPQGALGLKWTQLASFADSIPSRTVLVTLDTCFSGNGAQCFQPIDRVSVVLAGSCPDCTALPMTIAGKSIGMTAQLLTSKCPMSCYRISQLTKVMASKFCQAQFRKVSHMIHLQDYSAHQIRHCSNFQVCQGIHIYKGGDEPIHNWLPKVRGEFLKAEFATESVSQGLRPRKWWGRCCLRRMDQCVWNQKFRETHPKVFMHWVMMLILKNMQIKSD